MGHWAPRTGRGTGGGAVCSGDVPVTRTAVAWGKELPKDALMAGREGNCPVRVAAIGCGYWGKNLVRNFAELGALSAICDPDRNAARQLAERHHTRVAEFDAVLRDDEIAGVAIAAPAALHAELASRALEAGKHVFVEKPLALAVPEAEQLCAMAERVDRQLMVGHLLQYHPAFIKLRELVSEGVLGRLEYISSTRLNLGKVRREEDISPPTTAIRVRYTIRWRIMRTTR